MAQQSMKKSMLSLSIAVALAVSSGSLFADGDRVEELEARVAELEALVQQLLTRPAAAPGPSAADVDARAEAIAEEKVNAMLAEDARPLLPLAQTMAENGGVEVVTMDSSVIRSRSVKLHEDWKSGMVMNGMRARTEAIRAGVA